MGTKHNEFEPDEIFNELNRKLASVSLGEPSPSFDYKEITHEDLYEYKDILEYSTNYQDIHNATKCIRRYLTQDISLERIQHVFDLDILDKLGEFLTQPGYDEMKYEASWTITNLAYGTTEQTRVLINTGVIDALVHCFRTTESFRVKSQSAWALANVSIESPSYRESMANHQIINSVAQALISKCQIVFSKAASPIHEDHVTRSNTGLIMFQNSKSDTDDVKDLTWSLANICRGGFKTIEHWEQYLTAFLAFCQSIMFDNQEIWSEACWGLSRILSNMYNYEPFFEKLDLPHGLCPRLIHLLKNQNMSVVLPVLQTISNFSSGPNNYIEVLMDADLLNSIWWYMTPDTHQSLRRNAILTISNLAAGNEGIVRKVVYNENIMQTVINHVTVPGHLYSAEECKWIPSSKSTVPDTKDEWRIVKEALWVLSNITTLANDDSICALLRNHSKLIKSLASLLFYPSLTYTACSKVVDVLTRIVERTNQITELTPPVYPTPRNPYAEEMVREGVVTALAYLCDQIESMDLNQQVDYLQSVIMNASPHNSNGQGGDASMAAGMATEFGLERRGIHLPGTRRIVQSYEDGDVRSIEDALSAFQIQ